MAIQASLIRDPRRDFSAWGADAGSKTSKSFTDAFATFSELKMAKELHPYQKDLLDLNNQKLRLSNQEDELDLKKSKEFWDGGGIGGTYGGTDNLGAYVVNPAFTGGGNQTIEEDRIEEDRIEDPEPKLEPKLEPKPKPTGESDGSSMWNLQQGIDGGHIKEGDGEMSITHYGYAHDETPDSLTRQKVGNSANLLSERSLALKKSVADSIGAKPGDEIYTTGTDGSKILMGIYEDTIPPTSNGSIDIYDPTDSWGRKENFKFSLAPGATLIAGNNVGLTKHPGYTQ